MGQKHTLILMSEAAPSGQMVGKYSRMLYLWLE